MDRPTAAPLCGTVLTAIKFDCRSTRVKVFLPPLGWSGAMELLDHYGFDCPEDQYSVEKAWRFVFDTPEVRIHVEESALKALASTSIGQLAVGRNGINSGWQKSRSDRLRNPLQMLAAGGRRITVRFAQATLSADGSATPSPSIKGRC